MLLTNFPCGTVDTHKLQLSPALRNLSQTQTPVETLFFFFIGCLIIQPCIFRTKQPIAMATARHEDVAASTQTLLPRKGHMILGAQTIQWSMFP